jgi:phosphoribosylformylglycinamidine synthase
VLQFPAVADKTFLITIGDRTVGGLCSRDPMVGPWQVPVADAAVTLLDFTGYAGEAMAIGERTPLALIDAAASARMAVGEAITNIACAGIARMSDIKLSANWRRLPDIPRGCVLYDAVHAVAMSQTALISIRRRDSMSSGIRRDNAPRGGNGAAVAGRMAFAPVPDARAR